VIISLTSLLLPPLMTSSNIVNFHLRISTINSSSNSNHHHRHRTLLLINSIRSIFSHHYRPIIIRSITSLHLIIINLSISHHRIINSTIITVSSRP
jgi:hypothetical protein